VLKYRCGWCERKKNNMAESQHTQGGLKRQEERRTSAWKMKHLETEK
jgi:hypothetical protein